ncbi:hypothetical protein B0X71_14910 [Planococcus lenghuensis]|uniref:Uncharacterized protein n=2 Tax=Planococcus lenghuensis TaxID=2213202 RepID=A0A1Q2L1C8_9BACL|nr:hypothetical protein B0X71_14910 [Planococcus lenghuensis]
MLTIPVVSRGTKQQERERWSVFIRESAIEYHCLTLDVSITSDRLEISRVKLQDGYFEKIQVDLKNRRILFWSLQMDERQVKRCFNRMMEELILRTDSKRLVFMSSAANRKKNSLDTR